MSQILRNFQVVKDSIKVETMRSGSSPDEEKRYSSLDLRRVVAEAELQAHLAAELQAKQLVQEQEGRLTSAISALAGAENELRNARVRLLTDSAPQLMSIVMAIARRVVRTEMEIPGAIQPLIEEILQRVGQSRNVFARLAPQDLDYLRAQGTLPELEARGVRFVGDEKLAPGGCLVETDQGSWDSQIETQLERIEETLRTTVAEWADEEAA